ncbi:RNA metabolism protein [Lithospermum erythrorhizon]|uniref:RNA metabolism protein n=1 Tax=Lithospermum erythrorhizon TaxID=34254 RepID=A0AAV3PZP9_LITER
MEEAEQKLFVGGISWETTEGVLREHFNKFGNVVNCVIARDRLTGKPRGFAFISFAEPNAVDEALQETHEINGRTVDVKKAIPRSEQHSQQHQGRGFNSYRSSGWSSEVFRTKKIFVGGLAANLTEEDFKGYFEKFGRIMDVVVMHDNVTHRPRGFGFVTFDSEDSVEEVMQQQFHELSGKIVEVKRAIPKELKAVNNIYNTQSSVATNYNSYQNGNYTYNYRYGLPLGYGPIPAYGGVSGYPFVGGMFNGYPSGAYSGFGYGVASVAPRALWNSPAMIGIQGSPSPYFATSTMYPAHVNGRVGSIGSPANEFSSMVAEGSNGSEEARVEDSTLAPLA